MIEKIKNSKLVQKIKTIKHIEIYIVIFFIALLLVIYFSSFNGDKPLSSTNLSYQSGNSLTVSQNQQNDKLINLTQNYKNSLQNEIQKLIFDSINKNVEVEVCLKGGECFYLLDNTKDGSFLGDDLSITVSSGVTIIDYNPDVIKVIITNTQNLSIKDRITISNIALNYLNLNSSQIYLY